MNLSNESICRRSARCVRSALQGLMLAAAAFALNAQAQSAYPSKPVRVVVPFPAGTSPDVIARVWADKMRAAMGQPFLIDNRPGAVTIIGTQAVTTAPADGYTLLYTAQNTVSINPFVYKNLPYRADDLAPVSHIAEVPLVLIVASKSPIKSLADLIREARQNPGKMNYASYGVGQGTHVAMVRMLNAAGISINHVPYKDGGISDVMNGVVDVSFDASTTAIPQIAGGRLRALAVSSARRLESLPDVPTVAESVPGFLGDSWQGVLVRKGTPADIVARLSAESQHVIQSEDFLKRLRDVGLRPAGGTPADFAKFIADESAAFAQVVKDNGISIEQ